MGSSRDVELSPQNADGTPFLSYFDFLTSLSFIWDGESDHIEVRHGGDSEPVIDGIDVETLDANVHEEGATIEDWLNWFKVCCDLYVESYTARQTARICPVCGKSVTEGAHTCRGSA